MGGLFNHLCGNSTIVIKICTTMMALHFVGENLQVAFDVLQFLGLPDLQAESLLTTSVWEQRLSIAGGGLDGMVLDECLVIAIALCFVFGAFWFAVKNKQQLMYFVLILTVMYFEKIKDGCRN